MKLVVLGLVFAACVGVGVEMAARLKCRVRLLEAMGSLVRDLRSRMLQLGMTLPEALDAWAPDPTRPEGRMSACVKEEVQAPGITLPDAWRRAVERLHREHRQFCCLSAEDVGRLAEAGRYLGEMDMLSQERSMDFVAHILQEQIDQATANATRLGKLYNTMGVLTGIGLVVLLL